MVQLAKTKFRIAMTDIVWRCRPLPSFIWVWAGEAAAQPKEGENVKVKGRHRPTFTREIVQIINDGWMGGCV